jgi:hypothetical protein
MAASFRNATVYTMMHGSGETVQLASAFTRLSFRAGFSSKI